MQIAHLLHLGEERYSPVIMAVSTLETGLQSEANTHAVVSTPDEPDADSETDEDSNVATASESGSESEALAEEDVVYEAETSEPDPLGQEDAVDEEVSAPGAITLLSEPSEPLDEQQTSILR